MKPMMVASAMAAMAVTTAAAQAEPWATPWTAPRLPFNMTLSNTTPLAFGMGAAEAAQALGQPMRYVRGRPGNEIYLALRNLGGSGLVPSRHRLFLQFRHGRLTGWKEDYGENWMWE
jgi:hypothetical protein